MNAPLVFIDIGQSSWKARQGTDAFEFPLERQGSGRLTDLCRERLTTSLRGFFGRKAWGARPRAFCAIGARGVSLRRMTLPAVSPEELQRVVRLKIESEFPLSPEELAWGCRMIGAPIAGSHGGGASQEVMVAAVKKEALQEYAEILAACGVAPVFTVAALARAGAFAPPDGRHAVLDLGRTDSELTVFENGLAASLRMVAWGGETITLAIQEKLGVSHDEADKLKVALDAGGAAGVAEAMEAAVGRLAAGLNPASLGDKLYLTGKSARHPGLAAMLSRRLGGTPCQNLTAGAGDGDSGAIPGLQKSTEKNSALPPLLLQLQEGKRADRPGGRPAWPQAAAAALLLAGVLFFPYAEAMLLKPRLERKLASVQADRGRLTAIDQELAFLQDLKANQPPYLDMLYLLARSSQGMRVESLSMGRRGDLSLRAKLANAQQVTDFRSKLIESGWFSSVAVEEQTPSPDRRVAVRMTAQLKPAGSRKALVVDLTPKKRETQFASPPEMMFTPPPNFQPAPGAPLPAAMPPGGGPPPARGRRRGGASPPPGSLPPGVTIGPDGTIHMQSDPE